MKYESSILKRLIDTYGVVGNPRYISEIIKEFIVRGKECYPDLFTYQADWLAHIDEFGLTPEYTVSYTGQQIYAPNTLERPVKSAILKGSTKYRDIDTGEVLDAFEDGRNLELVSVKMPVLMTTGKNLYSGYEVGLLDFDTGLVDTTVTNACTTNFINIKWRENLKTNLPGRCIVLFYDANKEFVDTGWHEYSNANPTISIPNGYNLHYMRIRIRPGAESEAFKEMTDVMVVDVSDDINSYEPHKSNILTVNEDVTLRSNGDVYDELNLLTGRLTQRIDENNEVLSQEVIKTVDLTILDQNGQSVDHLKSFNGGTHFNTTSLEGSLLPTLSVDVVTDLEETLKVCSLEGNTM